MSTIPVSPFPQKLATLAVAAIVTMLAASSLLTWRVGGQVRSAVASQVEVVGAAQRVDHYGTILELSVKAVIAGSDAEAAERYRAVQPKLRRTLHQLKADLHLTPGTSEARRVDAADRALTAIEYEALALVARRQNAKARELIYSEKYDRLIAIYFAGVKRIEQQASTFVKRTEAQVDDYLSTMLALSVASFAVLLIMWMMVIRPTRRWGRDLKEAHLATERALGGLALAQAELEQANARLFTQARVDPLTGLSTRLRFSEDVERIWSDAGRDGHSYSLVMCDVDHFKQYNDHYGHPAGDDALRAVAAALTGAARESDRIYRYGGEEFLLVMRTGSVAAATACAERFRTAVEAMRLPHAVSPLRFLSVSMGVAQLDPQRHPTARGWIEQADIALYEAKRNGRNQVATERARAA